MTKIYLTTIISIIFYQLTYAQSKFPTDGSYVGIGTNTPTNRLTIVGNEGSNPSLLVQNTSYNSTHTLGTVSLRFAFLDHIGPRIEAFKISRNTTGLKFYTEFGYNIPQLGLIIKGSTNGPCVGIGTDNPDYNYSLSVNGRIRSTEIKVEAANWPDYVFESGYKMPTLSDLEKYIKVNNHLPEVPPAAEVQKNGINLGETNALLLKKIEELTLYLIQKDKQIERLEQRFDELDKKTSKVFKINSKTL